MFSRKGSRQPESFAKHRTTKGITKSKSSFRESQAQTRFERRKTPENCPDSPSVLNSPIVTLVVGTDARLFASHESVLSASPWFATMCRSQFLDSGTKRLVLADELPEVLSSVLEYLYKGDYYPRILPSKRRGQWELEDTIGDKGLRPVAESTVFHPQLKREILKDTLIYCAAELYGLPDLKKLALRKQGLQSGVQCSTILASARYAYANTPEDDSKLRAHYLALIIRSRHTFKRSGTMQMEMESGGRLFFDLFVAMVNHMDDISSAIKSPK